MRTSYRDATTLSKMSLGKLMMVLKQYPVYFLNVQWSVQYCRAY